jgi:MFS transporter, ACS family, glucarate transporter
VLALLSLLLVITYIDRVCISVAGPRMQEALHLGPLAWGWVIGVFTIAYAVFEIPSGVLGDRIGPRKVLTRIVVWWSIFTSLTGLVMGFYPLLLIRFLFGVGEAGAFPNTSVAVARWFPVHERGRAFGIIFMSVQVGGALTPFLVVPIQVHYGWRASFYLFGLFGVLWSILWYRWFRDTPAEKLGISAAELAETSGLVAKANHALPWKTALRSTNLWATLSVAFCYFYTFNFFQSWFHTYLVKARGYSEKDLLLSSLPFVVAAIGSICGGLVSNRVVRRVGLAWGRRSIGIAGLAIATVCVLLVPFVHHWLGALILLSLAYGSITFQQPIVFAVCLDIGGEYAGAVIGALNTASQLGSLASSLIFGLLVERFGNYELPLFPMGILLLIGALLWFKINANEQLISMPAPQTQIAAL